MPAFGPYVTQYECEMTTYNAYGGGSLKAERRLGQLYTVTFGEGGTEGSGASIGNTTNIGQKNYTLRGGAGGTAIPAGELPEGYASGTRADIVLNFNVFIGETQVNTYTVTVHRTFLVPQE